MNSIIKTFLDAYNSVPGQRQGFRTGDIIIFFLVYAAWYIVVSLVSYLIYAVRKNILMKRLNQSYSETHGMLSLDEDDSSETKIEKT